MHTGHKGHRSVYDPGGEGEILQAYCCVVQPAAYSDIYRNSVVDSLLEAIPGSVAGPARLRAARAQPRIVSSGRRHQHRKRKAAIWTVQTNGLRTLSWRATAGGAVSVMDTQWSNAADAGPSGSLAVRAGAAIESVVSGLCGMKLFAKGGSANARDVLIIRTVETRDQSLDIEAVTVDVS